MSKFSLSDFLSSFPRMKSFKIVPLILFTSLFINSCEIVQHDVVDAGSADFQLISVSVPDSFTYLSTDTNFPISVELSSSELVEGVYYDLYSSDKQQTYVILTSLHDDGLAVSGDKKANDNIYTALVEMEQSIPTGKYLIELSAQYLVFGEVKSMSLAKAYFDYNSGVANQPPVISNVTIPSSVNVGVEFIFSLQADDPNGLADVKEVYYELFRPDGSQVTNSNGIKQFPLYDNGDSSGNGDQVSGDGIYTNKLIFPNSNPPQQKGDWRFKFRAVDNAGENSNEIEKVVKLL